MLEGQADTVGEAEDGGGMAMSGGGMTADVELPSGGHEITVNPGDKFSTPEYPGPYRRIWGRVKLATILVKVNDTLEPGTYQVSGADAYLYSGGQTVGATPGPGTVTLTVPQQ